jgi:COP9 signalosome complex subunit 6
MEQSTKNPLLSNKPSESGLSVSIHPLVLLTISDQATRHSVRQQKGPLVGGLFGQQKGREITAEYAFPKELVQENGQWTFRLDPSPDKPSDTLSMEYRIDQCKVLRDQLGHSTLTSGRQESTPDSRFCGMVRPVSRDWTYACTRSTPKNSNIQIKRPFHPSNLPPRAGQGRQHYGTKIAVFCL